MYVRRQPIEAPTETEQTEARNEAIRARAELHNIRTATDALNKQIVDAKADLSKARETLTKILIEIDVTRVQCEDVQAAATSAYLRTLPPPVHGGALGLRRATREITDHERAKTLRNRKAAA